MTFDRQAKLLLDAHIKQWQELAKQLRLQVKPVIEAQQALGELVQKAMRPISENCVFRSIVNTDSDPS